MTSPILSKSEELRVYDDALQIIGNTPLLRLKNLGKDLPCPIYAKVEYFNPGGSIKDRIAENIIKKGENSGQLKPGGTVVECTSGNTGLGLAMVCAIKNYKAVFVLPDKMSQEKIRLLRAYGAKVIITPTAVAPDDPRSCYHVARRLASEIPNAFLANQYHNPENPYSHYLTTGPEIWKQTGGSVTDVVVGIGTGGTISGVGRYLKELNPNIRIIGVDPAGSLLLESWQKGLLDDSVETNTYKVEGIGEDFLPSTLDLSVIDHIIRVGDKESFLWARRLVREEAIFVGGSSGAAIAASVQHAQSLTPDRLVVVILPDSGSRYLSTFYDDQWMQENGFLEDIWHDMTLNEVLSVKTMAGLITAFVDDRIIDVITTMKSNNISQIPVLEVDGTLAGLVTEIDLLKHLVENCHGISADETIEKIVCPIQTVFPGNTSIRMALPSILENQVAIVTEKESPSGILTKIDILDFITQSI